MIFIFVLYLLPLVCLRVVSLHGVEIHLPVIPAHGVEAVAKETNTHSVSADAHGGDSRPHVRLRVVPANKTFISKQMKIQYYSLEKILIDYGYFLLNGD